jgi:hypothetical protein
MMMMKDQRTMPMKTGMKWHVQSICIVVVELDSTAVPVSAERDGTHYILAEEI